MELKTNYMFRKDFNRYIMRASLKSLKGGVSYITDRVLREIANHPLKSETIQAIFNFRRSDATKALLENASVPFKVKYKFFKTQPKEMSRYALRGMVKNVKDKQKLGKHLLHQLEKRLGEKGMGYIVLNSTLLNDIARVCGLSQADYQSWKIVDLFLVGETLRRRYYYSSSDYAKKGWQKCRYKKEFVYFVIDQSVKEQTYEYLIHLIRNFELFSVYKKAILENTIPHIKDKDMCYLPFLRQCARSFFNCKVLSLSDLKYIAKHIQLETEEEKYYGDKDYEMVAYIKALKDCLY